MKENYGGMMSLGKGAAAIKSSRHRINSRSSIKSDIIGVDDNMPGVLWELRLLGAQGFKVNKNIVYQDDQNAILMDRNGKYSCGNKTRHIDMRHFSPLTASSRRMSAPNTAPQSKRPMTTSPKLCREHCSVDMWLQL